MQKFLNFSGQNINVFENTLATSVNKFEINELVKLKMLWTTEHWTSILRHWCIKKCSINDNVVPDAAFSIWSIYIVCSGLSVTILIIMKTRLFKYIENFTTKKIKIFR